MLDSAVSFTNNKYSYLRRVLGTEVKFEVAPSWDYGNIVVNANIDQTNALPAGGLVFNEPKEGETYATSGTIFCPGDELVLTTNNKDADGAVVGPNGANTKGDFVMWDFDGAAPQSGALFTVPSTTTTIKAIYAPKDYWYQVVTTQPNTFTVDYDGNVTIGDANALDW